MQRVRGKRQSQQSLEVTRKGLVTCSDPHLGKVLWLENNWVWPQLEAACFGGASRGGPGRDVEGPESSPVWSSVHLGTDLEAQGQVQCGQHLEAPGKMGMATGEYTVGKGTSSHGFLARSCAGPALSHSSWAFQVSHIGK